MKHGTKLLTLFAALFGLLFASAVMSPLAQARKLDGIDVTAKIKKIPPRPALFDKDVKPLTMEQCAQCHIGVFKLLKSKGHRHQKECTFCHEVYHTYAPGMVKYEDALPKCPDCHGHPHGEKPVVTDCHSCHSNAHSPLNLPNITGKCFNCHPGPPEALKKFPSKHSELDCMDCHIRHGYIPKCIDCHSEKGGEVFHIPGDQPNKVCLTCHAGPHKPMQISYGEDTPKKYCADCHNNPSHAKVYATLTMANSKHNTELTCASCHTEHGKIPSCFDCHDHEGHRAGLKFEDCLSCHTDPHAPLKITFAPTIPKKVCGGCHKKEYSDLMNSNTRHTKLSCAFCHPKHGYLPKCQQCHGVPHGKAIVDKFGGKCGPCHGTAHNVKGRMHNPPKTPIVMKNPPKP